MQISSSAVGNLVLPKIHSAQDLHHVSRAIFTSSVDRHSGLPLGIIPSIESARGMWNLGHIAGWKSEYGPSFGGSLNALLVCTLCASCCASNGNLEVCS